MIVHDCFDTMRRDCKNLHIQDVRDLQEQHNRGLADFDSAYPEDNPDTEEELMRELRIVDETYFETFTEE